MTDTTSALNRWPNASWTRHHLSSQHLYSAYVFAEKAAVAEQCEALNTEARLLHSCHVTTSIMSAVAFLEACVNELFTVCAEHPDDIQVRGHPQDPRFGCIGTAAIQQIGAVWQVEGFQRYAKLLDKFQTALRLANKPAFSLGANPYQDAKLVVQLRNIRPPDIAR